MRVFIQRPTSRIAKAFVLGLVPILATTAAVLLTRDASKAASPPVHDHTQMKTGQGARPVSLTSHRMWEQLQATRACRQPLRE